VTVSIKFSGRFASGAHYETAEFFFPLQVYQTKIPLLDLTTRQCTPNSALVPTATSGGNPPACSNWGQDGVPFACVCQNCNSLCDTATQKCDPTSCTCVAK
jgi:hypothetical protein